MIPQKPMTNKEISQTFDRMRSINVSLREENASLKEKVANLESDSNAIKADNVIINFKKLKKSELTALTAAEKNLLVFKVLKALCREALSD